MLSLTPNPMPWYNTGSFSDPNQISMEADTHMVDAVQTQVKRLKGVFTKSKATDNCVRFSVDKKGSSVFGSLYILNEDVPEGCESIQVQIKFVV